jgi:hypothetical protein
MPRVSRTAPGENLQASALSRLSRSLSWRCSRFFPGSIRSVKIMPPSGKSWKNYENDRSQFSRGVIFLSFRGDSPPTPPPHQPSPGAPWQVTLRRAFGSRPGTEGGSRPTPSPMRQGGWPGFFPEWWGGWQGTPLAIPGSGAPSGDLVSWGAPSPCLFRKRRLSWPESIFIVNMLN